MMAVDHNICIQMKQKKVIYDDFKMKKTLLVSTVYKHK